MRSREYFPLEIQWFAASSLYTITVRLQNTKPQDHEDRQPPIKMRPPTVVRRGDTDATVVRRGVTGATIVRRGDTDANNVTFRFPRKYAHGRILMAKL